jgi:hypothetical protein
LQPLLSEPFYLFVHFALSSSLCTTTLY